MSQYSGNETISGRLWGPSILGPFRVSCKKLTVYAQLPSARGGEGTIFKTQHSTRVPEV